MTTTTKPRQSRAQRAASKAEADAISAAEAGAIEPTAEAAVEAAKPDPDELDDDQDQADDDDQDEPEAEPEPEPKVALPVATWNPGLYQLPQYKPTVTGPDSTTYTCPHKWGHGDEKAARTCAGHLAAEAGLRIA